MEYEIFVKTNVNIPDMTTFALFAYYCEAYENVKFFVTPLNETTHKYLLYAEDTEHLENIKKILAIYKVNFSMVVPIFN